MSLPDATHTSSHFCLYNFVQKEVLGITSKCYLCQHTLTLLRYILSRESEKGLREGD